jgi:VIT1/CCC1 family predicted Fe2+/Mn2+ transporter
MPKAHDHHEAHFTSGIFVRDVVIGMADGLTVPFALAAGLSGATVATHIIVTAGLAEIAAGSIAMGLGGYLAARGDSEHYESERRREILECETVPEIEKAECAEVFQKYGLTAQQAAPIVEALSHNQTAWVDFMMRFELGLEEPDPSRAWKSATTIALSYIVGGLVPLAPYFFASSIHRALLLSIAFTLTALTLFGYAKGKATGISGLRSALQTTLIGGLAAAAAFLLARLFSH